MRALTTEVCSDAGDSAPIAWHSSHFFIPTQPIETQVEDLFQQCSPSNDNLCLYGHPDGSWECALPCEEVGGCNRAGRYKATYLFHPSPAFPLGSLLDPNPNFWTHLQRSLFALHRCPQSFRNQRWASILPGERRQQPAPPACLCLCYSMALG
jgi:hypothetical protein